MTVLSLYEDLLAPGERVTLPPVERALFVASGHVEGDVRLAAGEAWRGDDEVALRAGDEGATLLRFELTDWAVDDAKLSVPLDLDPWVEHVIRCERGPAAAVGPARGIGCLLTGRASADGRPLGALDAWPEPAELDGDGDVLRVTVVPADGS